ncbi:phosphatase PAP2 family protein [Alkalihalophilus pseudofirmus]|uniref:phosphatase PAP2 family protein n=1 Tax=Alkalihalophilus pseudofirmus TaxID=79885 RepID=UPI00259B6D6E|nr:phosphatase PAP2 family protein [Alkalihalophilus pseudofirmus]WEG17884.1 phosphatase PAP2 family protein [Alkalihalophilus pseudofirmus]
MKINVIYILTISVFLSMVFFIDSNEFDKLLLDWMNQLIPSSLQEPMSFLTKLGSGEVMIILTLVLMGFLYFKREKLYALMLGVIVFGGLFLNLGLKLLFQRERPGEIRYLEVFGQSFELASYSFPSGHTMRTFLLFAFIIYISYLFITKRAIRLMSYAIAVFCISVVALSRMILEAHYPSDIIAAISISILWFIICIRVVPGLVRKYTRTQAPS